MAKGDQIWYKKTKNDYTVVIYSFPWKKKSSKCLEGSSSEYVTVKLSISAAIFRIDILKGVTHGH